MVCMFKAHHGVRVPINGHVRHSLVIVYQYTINLLVKTVVTSADLHFQSPGFSSSRYSVTLIQVIGLVLIVATL